MKSDRDPVMSWVSRSLWLVLPVAGCAYLFSGWRAVIGVGFGVIATGGSIVATTWVVRNSVVNTSQKGSAVMRLQLAMLIKLPLLALVIFFTNSLGVSAIFGFIGGMGLVYLSLLAGAMFKGFAPANSE